MFPWTDKTRVLAVIQETDTSLKDTGPDWQAFTREFSYDTPWQALGTLVAGSKSVGEVATMLSMSASRASRLLFRLKRYDLVHIEQRGTARIYSINSDRVQFVGPSDDTVEVHLCTADGYSLRLQPPNFTTDSDTSS